MLRLAITIVVLTGLGLAGYYYVSDKSNADTGARVRSAVEKTGETAIEESVAVGVRAQLTVALGRETARFLHVHNHDGHILVYGLLNSGVDEAKIIADAQRVPGVKDVQVMVMPRPANLTAEADTQPQSDQPPAVAKP